MAIPIEKVEVGFDQSFSGSANFFTLDDATKGQLDSASFPLAGLQFIDITARVRELSVSRGRKSIFAAFPAGQATITLNNHDRAFDPLYTASPFAGNIIPRREIRVTSGGKFIFNGWIDDWNLTYLPNGDSVVEAIAYDAGSILSGQVLAAGTPTPELTGTRVSQVLDDVNWSSELRDIDAGLANLSDFPIEENTNVMAYLQQVANSEPGLVFVDKDGKVAFKDRSTTPTSATLIDLGGTAIPIANLEVVYGSEKLYNQISVSREGGGTATASNLQSISDYGAREFEQNNLLLSTDGALVDLAVVLAERYSEPEYRFSALEVAVHKLDAADQETVLDAEIGDVARVTFTPNNIGDPIIRFVQIININHTVNTEAHFVEFGFQALDYAALVLNDAEFGKLDTYSLSW